MHKGRRFVRGYIFAVCVAWMMVLCGCEGDGDSSSSSDNASIAGIWTIVWNADAEPRNILIIESATLTQNGATVVGSGIGVRNGQASAQASISGTIRGKAFSFDIVWKGLHGTGTTTVTHDTFNGRGHADWDNSSGYFTGVRK